MQYRSGKSFARLQDKLLELIANLSLQEKKYITPSLFIDRVEINESEIEEILEELVKDKKLKKKFEFECKECGLSFEINNLYEEYKCEECGEIILPLENFNMLNNVYYEFLQEQSVDKMNGSNYRKYLDVEMKPKVENRRDAQVIDINSRKSQIKTKGEKEDMNEVNKIEKIFISHASADKEYADLLVQLLNDIGIDKSADKIFYSSMHAYGIPLAENIYDYLKSELNKNIMVIFLLSDNYYTSAACLNEMGATWISNKDYYTVLLPNFEFKDIKGAINPMDISFKIEDKDMLNQFKDVIIDKFGLNQINSSIWENDRDKFISNINEIDKKYKLNNPKCKIEIDRVKGKGKNEIEIAIRFINNGNRDEECQEIIFNLEDEDSRKISISAPEEFFEGKIIYPGENRRELITVKSTDDKFMNKRIKEYSVDFRWV